MQSILESVSIRTLFDVGAHLGHKTQFWHPSMVSYIYGTSNAKTHIINLQKTVPMMRYALKKICEVSSNSGRILFIGTKTQASCFIKSEAQRCGQYYVNVRWPGGMLTNWSTVSKSIKRLEYYEKVLERDSDSLRKKEILSLERKRDRIEKYLGGVRRMGGLPSLIFIVDPRREHVAVAEANRLGIPIVAVVDTNCDPTKISYPIPGNDDSSRSVEYYCKLVADAVLAGIEYDLQRKQKVRARRDQDAPRTRRSFTSGADKKVASEKSEE